MLGASLGEGETVGLYDDVGLVVEGECEGGKLIDGCMVVGVTDGDGEGLGDSVGTVVGLGFVGSMLGLGVGWGLAVGTRLAVGAALAFLVGALVDGDTDGLSVGTLVGCPLALGNTGNAVGGTVC